MSENVAATVADIHGAAVRADREASTRQERQAAAECADTDRAAFITRAWENAAKSWEQHAALHEDKNLEEAALAWEAAGRAWYAARNGGLGPVT